MSLHRLQRIIPLAVEDATKQGGGYARYHADPEGYCRDVLRVRLTPDQRRICRSLVTPPYKTLVRAGHNVGKSFVSACLVNWWYDTRKPGICLTTAPTDRQVKDILWKEVRVLRGQRGGFIGPREPRLESSPDHYAHGFTARDGDRFQGHHSPNVLIVFDEAVGVAPVFWEAAETMLEGQSYAFLAIYNPTDQGSAAARAERESGYNVLTMSCIDHPNIQAELAGQPPPYPSAIKLGRLSEMMEQWATPIPANEAGPWDIRLPRGSLEQWYRPGPVAEARLLGRWPRQSINAVWSDAAWQLAETRELPLSGRLQIGCDVARYGDDFTCIHVRWGGVSLHHESHNGWSTVQTARRLQQMCERWAKFMDTTSRLPVGKRDPKRVPVAIDDAGVGGGVVDIGRDEGWNFIPVLSAAMAHEPTEYPNMRSALWFGVADEAGKGNISFAKLPANVRQELRDELLAPTYQLDIRGRRVVEPKDATKQRLKRSPDNADAMNLAYARVADSSEDRVSGRVQVA